jgi:hypothetical protein
MSLKTDRRSALQSFGLALGAAGAVAATEFSATSAHAAGMNLPEGAASLAELTKRLAAAPRRRDFKTVPMIVDHPDLWDDAALKELFAYKPAAKMVWDVTGLPGLALNGMRNTINAQVWSFGNPDFLALSANHGGAQLALYDQEVWDKYDIAKMAGGMTANSLIVEKPAASKDAANYQDPDGVFSPENNTIPALQKRGAVFLACHNAIWEQASKLHKAGQNPDNLPVEAIAAELTNHLIPGAVLTPGIVATIVELQNAGFTYAR